MIFSTFSVHYSEYLCIFAIRNFNISIMATTFVLLNKEAKGTVPLYIRIQHPAPKINIRVKTDLSVPAEKWRLDRNGAAWANYIKSETGAHVNTKIEQIRNAVDSRLKEGQVLTSDDVKKICNDIIYREEREEQLRQEEAKRRAEEEAKRMTLSKYIDQYVKDIFSGARQTERGNNFAHGTAKTFRESMTVWKTFQKETQTIYDFNDIDITVYFKYTEWMKNRHYSINTIGKHIANLKSILRCAESEGYNQNQKFKDKRFKGTRVEVDSIYLTKEDLEKFCAVDLSKMPVGYQQARDIFLVGCWTSQRVSDYNNISRDAIQSYTKRAIVDVPDPEHPGKIKAEIQTREVMYINIRQHKTGAKVAVPCSSELKTILERYNYQMPHLADQVINRYIKEIGKMAGIDEMIEMVETKGGNKTTVKYEKYKLIHSHTARRTGATLMYLAGMDVYDIMKITGHSSPNMLKKYIKADQLEVVDKIIDKYNYFD